MSGGLGSLGPDYAIAERVRQQLEPFTEKFRDLGDPDELRTILTGTRTLSGPRVRQQPEDFTEQYLIEPVLHALGYWNPTSEQYESGEPHYIRRPSEFQQIESKRPDYKLENVGSPIVCFLESKAANRERLSGSKREASEDVEYYLQNDTFCKVLRETDHQYLVGIGTDGLRWTLSWKNLETRDIFQDHAKVDLSTILEANARRDGTLEGDPQMTRYEQRERLVEEFIPTFAARNLDEHIDRR